MLPGTFLILQLLKPISQIPISRRASLISSAIAKESTAYCQIGKRDGKKRMNVERPIVEETLLLWSRLTLATSELGGKLVFTRFYGQFQALIPPEKKTRQEWDSSEFPLLSPRQCRLYTNTI
jgi:hypothetical protein